MFEKSKAQNPEPPPVTYAFWEDPETSLKVVYSLQLFHEIDFVVNEGYRKIPHGGIEVGGLLFGTVDKESIRIEAFRPIDCEHASGPTLTFSERDLTELKRQISESASDSELKKLRPVGWFLTHTRGPLELTDTEAKLFDQFFPEPFRLTVLVKPERFQPTRFGFLVRTADNRMPRDATSRAVILPLPGRSHTPGQMMPSLAAPQPGNTAKRTVDRAASERPSIVRPDTAEETRDLPKEIKPEPADSEPPVVRPRETRTFGEIAAHRQFSRDRARVIEQAYPSRQHQPPPPEEPALPSPQAQVSAPPAITISPGATYRRYQPAAELSASPTDTVSQSVLNARSITALALAALLGCLVGYIAYLQLPAPIIPIDVRSLNQTVIVSWPPNETRSAIYAAVRLNDGPPVPLSAEEKKSGQVSLSAAKDFKIELLARNWIRDSRGIVRYLHSTNGNGQVTPSNSPTLP